jgi:hypothetical protein
MNQMAAGAADEVHLLVSGIPVHKVWEGERHGGRQTLRGSRVSMEKPQEGGGPSDRLLMPHGLWASSRPRGKVAGIAERMDLSRKTVVVMAATTVPDGVSAYLSDGQMVRALPQVLPG